MGRDMRIKIHNSLCKTHNRSFIFNEISFVYINNRNFSLSYMFNDRHYFLRFSSETNKFYEELGFGNNRKILKDWHKAYDWKEVGK